MLIANASWAPEYQRLLANPSYHHVSQLTLQSCVPATYFGQQLLHGHQIPPPLHLHNLVAMSLQLTRLRSSQTYTTCGFWQIFFLWILGTSFGFRLLVLLLVVLIFTNNLEVSWSNDAFAHPALIYLCVPVFAWTCIAPILEVIGLVFRDSFFLLSSPSSISWYCLFWR